MLELWFKGREAHFRAFRALSRPSWSRWPRLRRASLAGLPTRLALVIGLLLGGLLLTRWAGPPPPPAPPAPAPDTPGADHVFFADVEGWYRVTRNERAVASPFDLRLENLPDALPTRIGDWTATDLPMNPQVDTLYDHPEVAFQRAYQNPQGDLVWLTVIGHRGAPSFHLFEHTPTICYPLQGWAMLREQVDAIPVRGGQFYAQRGLARNEADQSQLVLFYWYLWDTEARDPKDGIVSLRISAPVRDSEEAAATMLKQSFIPALFPVVVPWRRF